jgi:hypothetical protein
MAAPKIFFSYPQAAGRLPHLSGGNADGAMTNLLEQAINCDERRPDAVTVRRLECCLMQFPGLAPKSHRVCPGFLPLRRELHPKL